MAGKSEGGRVHVVNLFWVDGRNVSKLADTDSRGEDAAGVAVDFRGPRDLEAAGELEAEAEAFRAREDRPHPQNAPAIWRKRSSSLSASSWAPH